MLSRFRLRRLTWVRIDKKSYLKHASFERVFTDQHKMTRLEFTLKMLFGFVLMILVAAIALVIALGKVEQQTSYGLQDILGGLLVLSGSFSHWAFQAVSAIKQEKSSSSSSEEEEEETQARTATKEQL